MAETFISPNTARHGRLSDQMQAPIRTKHCCRSTEKTHVHWTKRRILFRNKRHLAAMAEDEIRAYLTYLAVEARVAPPTQNQPHCTIPITTRSPCATPKGTRTG